MWGVLCVKILKKRSHMVDLIRDQGSICCISGVATACVKPPEQLEVSVNERQGLVS